MKSELAAFCNCNEALEYGAVDWESLDYSESCVDSIIWSFRHVAVNAAGFPLPSYIEYLYQAAKRGVRIQLQDRSAPVRLAFIERWLQDNGINRTLRAITRRCFPRISNVPDFQIGSLSWREAAYRLHTRPGSMPHSESFFRGLAGGFYSRCPELGNVAYMKTPEGWHPRLRIMLNQWRRSRPGELAQVNLATAVDHELRRCLRPMVRLRTLIKQDPLLRLLNHGHHGLVFQIGSTEFVIPEVDQYSHTHFRNLATIPVRQLAQLQRRV